MLRNNMPFLCNAEHPICYVTQQHALSYTMQSTPFIMLRNNMPFLAQRRAPEQLFG